MDHGLLVVDMYAVVGDEHAGRRAVSVGCEMAVLVEGVDGVGKCAALGLYAYLPCPAKQRQIRALDLSAVLARAGERVLQVDRLRISRLGVGRQASIPTSQ